jgi:hypothetical protein
MSNKKKKKVRYPDNLALKEQLKDTGRSIGWYAKKLDLSREVISKTINGHYKGINIVPKLIELLTQ